MSRIPLPAFAHLPAHLKCVSTSPQIPSPTAPNATPAPWKLSTHSLALESLNDTVPLAHIVVDRLEVAQDLLRQLNRLLVLKDRLVVGQVNGGGSSLESRVLVQGGRVSSAERLEGSEGLLVETETGVDLGPVLQRAKLVVSRRFLYVHVRTTTEAADLVAILGNER